MKKIISLIATAALALGFVSCSGDLHDLNLIDLSDYAVIGSLNDFNNTANPLTKNSDGTYSATWTAVCGGQTKAAGSDAGETFAIIQKGDAGWSTAYRLAQPKVDGDKANTFTKSGDEQNVYQGQSADCMLIPNSVVSKGDTVKLTITPDSAFIKVKVEVVKGSGAAETTPTPFHLDGFFISGSMNGGAATLTEALYDPIVDTKTGILTYKYDFTFKPAENASQTEADFGIRNATSNWAVKYTAGTFAVGTDTDYVATKSGDSTNNKITGLVSGNSYRIYVQTTPEKKVSYKVVVLNTVKFSVNVSELPAALDGKEFYIRGGMNGWNIGDGYKATVANNALSVKWNYIYEGTSFKDLKYDFKFSVKGGDASDRATGDGWGLQLSGADGGNLSMTLSKTATSANFAYADLTGKTDNDTCTYYVLEAKK